MALARLIAGGLLPSVHSLRRGDQQGRVDQGAGLRVERRDTRIGVQGRVRQGAGVRGRVRQGAGVRGRVDQGAGVRGAAQASVDCSRRQAYCLR